MINFPQALSRRQFLAGAVAAAAAAATSKLLTLAPPSAAATAPASPNVWAGLDLGVGESTSFSFSIGPVCGFSVGDLIKVQFGSTPAGTHRVIAIWPDGMRVKEVGRIFLGHARAPRAVLPPPTPSFKFVLPAAEIQRLSPAPDRVSKLLAETAIHNFGESIGGAKSPHYLQSSHRTGPHPR